MQGPNADKFFPVHQGMIWSLVSSSFAVLHPLLMVIGFILISGEAILVHSWLPGPRSLKKSVHLCLQGVALASGIFGIWTKFQGEDGIVANFFSLHSWMGLTCICLFAAQWLMGFMSFWHRGEMRAVRVKVLPWHIFLGLYTYGLAVATAETGLLEKLTFLQANRNLSKRSPESMVVNSLGLSLALLSGMVIFAAVSPKSHNLQSHREVQVGYCRSFCYLNVNEQWAAGFSMFWYPGGSISSRASLLPWHVFFGIYTYALAVGTACTGILEKATFLQTNHVISRYSTEAVLLNLLGMLIVVLGGCVILAVVTSMNGKGKAYIPLEYTMQHPSV
ncbi:hypothetical protein GH714_041040 [Hevea brasiliensis]|uniref:ascorbate ferrireductase (transmembrane) n=1 Tax=Hevea brasiliensis TaxID=3981 RepID=A0A6A6NA47_HEVBR|nr:hypothetical protein GH714_041040 [Hevea brasiliensis]